MSVWTIASIPFWVLGSYGSLVCLLMVITGCGEAARGEVNALRESVVNLTIWLLITGAALLIAARVAS